MFSEGSQPEGLGPQAAQTPVDRERSKIGFGGANSPAQV